MNPLITAIMATALLGGDPVAQTPVGRPTVVLVHGAFVDGSGWAGVHRILSDKGYNVVVVQTPTSSLEEDVAATTRAIDETGQNVILVGHSYGGVVITEAGRHPKVSALVYVAAFAPDAGESVSSLVPPPTPGAPPSPILPPKDGYLVIDHDAFSTAFGADLDPSLAKFMADSQVSWGVRAFAGKVSAPAWKTKRSYFLIPAHDRIIPPAAQRGMAERAGAIVRETRGSHAVYISYPTAVAELIVQAAEQ